jgi:hypothetical protein
VEVVDLGGQSCPFQRTHVHLSGCWPHPPSCMVTP